MCEELVDWKKLGGVLEEVKEGKHKSGDILPLTNGVTIEVISNNKIALVRENERSVYKYIGI